MRYWGFRFVLGPPLPVRRTTNCECCLRRHLFDWGAGPRRLAYVCESCIERVCQETYVMVKV